MRNLTLIGLLLFLTGASWAQCSDIPRTHDRLHWSELANIVAPDHYWSIEVHPVFEADGNQTPVILHRCGESKIWPLFTLERSAELYWSSDSKHILVVNEPLSGTSKLLLFSIAGLTTDAQKSPPDALDISVNETLTERLGKHRHIQFYLPAFVSWKGNTLLLAVGGETYTENPGPFDTYCYGMGINSETLRVEYVLSEKQLEANTGHSCRVSP